MVFCLFVICVFSVLNFLICWLIGFGFKWYLFGSLIIVFLKWLSIVFIK